MSTQTAAAPELSRLGSAILDFKARYERLASPAYGAAIARTGDNALMLEYGETLAKAERIKAAIDGIEGAWTKAREWSGLAVLPLVPLAVAAGVTALVIGGISLLDDFMLRADARRIQLENPTLTFEQARARALTLQPVSTASKALNVMQIALIVGGAWLLYLFLRR